MATTPNLGITLLSRMQTAKEQSINDALLAVDAAYAGLANTSAVNAARDAMIAALGAAYAGNATADQLAAAKAAILAAVASLGSVNVTGSLTAYDVATQAELLTVKTALLAAIASINLSTSLTSAGTATAANVSAGTATIATAITSAVAPLATTANVAANTTTVTGAITAAQTHIESASAGAHAATQTAITNAIAADTANTNSKLTDPNTGLAAIKSAISAMGSGGGGSSSSSASLFPSGYVAQFQANLIPTDWSNLAGTTYSTTGGMASSSVAGGQGSMAVMAYVTEGSAAGLWSYGNNIFQRFSVASNKAVGSAYQGARPGQGGYSGPFLTAVGKFLYYGAISNGSPDTGLFQFDTETGLTTAMAPFPRPIGSQIYAATAIRLPSGVILICPRDSTRAGGITVTPDAVPFFLYDPATNATPIEVLVSLPLTMIASAGGAGGQHSMCLLPHGRVLIQEVAAPSAGNRQSCELVVAGTSIYATNQADTGNRTAANYNFYGLGLLPTATGAYCAYAGTAYTEGLGWSPAPNPVAYGSITYPYWCEKIPGVGFMCVSTSLYNGCSTSAILYATSDAGAGTTITSARKN